MHIKAIFCNILFYIYIICAVYINMLKSYLSCLYNRLIKINDSVIIITI